MKQSAGVMSLRDAQALTGKPRQVTMYGIKVTDPAQAEAIQKQLEAALPDVSILMASAFAENLPDMKSMNVMMWGIGLLAIVVGGISMMNTMIMSVYERTREIGTLRAVGWRRRRVLGDGAEGIGGAESARHTRRICERHRAAVADAVHSAVGRFHDDHRCRPTCCR